MKTKEDASVKINKLVKTYTDDRGRPTFTAVKNISLDIKNGEFMVLVGPSGCGKSTTSEWWRGSKRSPAGRSRLARRSSTTWSRRIVEYRMVFQSYALYPHMNLFNNMAFGLKLAKKPKEFISDIVRQDFESLGASTYAGTQTGALSGGQRQSVALGRAIVRDPKVFLFDEPLSNLDAKMRVQMRTEISRLHAELGSTMIYVTHDQVEAMTMGDRICVMRDGLIMQVADPLTLFRHPDNLFVAGFIGSPPMNLLKGRIQKKDGGLVFVETADANPLTLPIRGYLESVAGKHVDKEVVFGIRPEQIDNEPRADVTSMPVNLVVEIAEPMGSESIVYLKTGSGSIIARIQGDHIFHLGEQVVAHFDLDKVTLFDPKTESVLK